jgi:hypothetical protein
MVAVLKSMMLRIPVRPAAHLLTISHDFERQLAADSAAVPVADNSGRLTLLHGQGASWAVDRYWRMALTY